MIELDRALVTAPAPDGRGTLTILNVTCTIASHRTAVIGENGSGKSTLARLAGGLVKPSSGTVNAPDRIGFLFSNPGAQPIMPTVHEDVALSFKGMGLSRPEVRERTDRALAEHDLTDLADHSCHTLSSGQQQRLALCAILAGAPDLLIADEPTSYLDARHRRIVADRLFAPSGPALLLVTHDLDLAARCDEVVFIADGRIVSQGQPAPVIAEYERSLA